MAQRADNYTIRYSEQIAGDFCNFEWPVRFDDSAGYCIGINQYQDGKVSDRVLLSRSQLKALMAFISQKK